MKRLTALCSLFMLILCPPAAAQESAARQKAGRDYSAGNFKDAYEGYRALLLDKNASSAELEPALRQAVNCLSHLGSADEFDELVEAAAAAHPAEPRLLAAAAGQYLSGRSYGSIVAGKFYRGYRRKSDGRPVNTYRRDRVRALQLYLQALQHAGGNPALAADLYHSLALALSRNFEDGFAWQLQRLTDLSQLPDYEDYHYAGGGLSAAPAAPDGTPVLFHIPRSWEAAANDGERFRWALMQEVELDRGRADAVAFLLAGYWRNLYGVQNIASYSFSGGRDDDTDIGTYAVHTLGENETITRLASGIKRFELPDEFNFIKTYLQLAGNGAPRPDLKHGAASLDALVSIFQDRRQYPEAAKHLQSCINVFGPGHRGERQKLLQQIVGAWGVFEPSSTRPAGKEASLQLRFRNASSVSLEAYELNIEKLLGDIKQYFKSNPPNLDYEKISPSYVGTLLVHKNQLQYRGKKAASWLQELSPRPNHFDTRTAIKTPLTKAGGYLVNARVAGGNKTSVVLWIADTVIVKKPTADGALYFTADAETGKPLADMNLEFFGYRQESLNQPVRTGRAGDRWYNILTSQFSGETDKNGLLVPGRHESNYEWLITANGPGGRFAYLGFTSVWSRGWYDEQLNQTKIYFITDRPVYRPHQIVKLKAWAGQARYGDHGRAAFAGRNFTLRIFNPKNEKVLEKELQSDAYGGIEAELALPQDAALGVYRATVDNFGFQGTFRVEEYKKPEFEVTVEAPEEPVMLGEKIRAKVKASYYFGAPVTDASVKYKVLRTSHEASWCPPGTWDWLFGPGYWWFAYDYAWLPGWSEWGFRRPLPSWWPSGQEAPELLQENEVPIGSDGTVDISIDTGPAKELQGDTDHRYQITAEVVDKSRRSITGSGEVLAARKPFKVYAWLDRGYYRAGEAIQADFLAQTLDHKPIQGQGQLKLIKVGYDAQGQPHEKAVEEWTLDTDSSGRAKMPVKAAAAGQYRLSYTVTDSAGRAIEGGYVFTITGSGFKGDSYRFNDLEIIPDKKEYAPEEKVRLMINTNRTSGTILLFIKPAHGAYSMPEVIRLEGKSTIREIPVAAKDMPNFFVEALTVSGAQIFSEVKEIAVPPENKMLDVEVLPSAQSYKPGETASIALKVTDLKGSPFAGSLVMSVYDKALEYISGGSNVSDIKSFFWKWRRAHNPYQESSLIESLPALDPPGEPAMQVLGALGGIIEDSENDEVFKEKGGGRMARREVKKDAVTARMRGLSAPAEGAPAASAPADSMQLAQAEESAGEPQDPGPAAAQPLVRKEFADTAFWAGSITADAEGRAQISFKMPENLTQWKIRTWAMGADAKVGEGTASVVTAKNLLLRLQAPRFFVENDEVVLSANIHNYLKSSKTVRAKIELPGGGLQLLNEAEQQLQVEPSTDKRVDWRVKVVKEGPAVVRMLALSDEESDAMEMTFPAYVHGMLKTDSYSGSISPGQSASSFIINVPQERRISQTKLEIRYSPSLAAAMVDALPYLVNYPYGCTEQTLNRFLPTALAQKILLDLHLKLEDIRKKRTNLNAQELGEADQRAGQWKRYKEEPVFDEDEVARMVKAGVERLRSMQLSDGGWGWFSGWGEQSTAHMTAYVVHGLQNARAAGVNDVPQEMIERGIGWLKHYQAGELQQLRNAARKITPYKEYADNLDSFVYMVLTDAGAPNAEMQEHLYRDRTRLAVYGKAMFGMALYKEKQAEKLDMVMKNIGQYLVQDDENQTAYLKTDAGWWYWYGSEYEAMAYYLKLLARIDPQGAAAPRLIKYLLNNRKHSTYWNSTRDTSLLVEAFADYLRAAKEAEPDMTVQVLVDGKKHKEVHITKDNLFSYDNTLVLLGDALSSGKHTVEVRKQGRGSVYFNGYLTNFTLEDFITKAGLEIKVNRKYYKLERSEKSHLTPGALGQALEQRSDKYERREIENGALLKSGDLVEVELEIDSKNDYEYMLFEDMKAAGFEPVEVRSGYNGNDLGAYVEYRDERVAFFARTLARGKHSTAYRLRAEIPGKFSALPVQASAMYAPELKGNSDEFKVQVAD